MEEIVIKAIGIGVLKKILKGMISHPQVQERSLLKSSFLKLRKFFWKKKSSKIIGRVKDCMIAGNAFDTFNNITALGNKPEWHGSTMLPHFYFQALNVAGNSKRE